MSTTAIAIGGAPLHRGRVGRAAGRPPRRRDQPGDRGAHRPGRARRPGGHRPRRPRSPRARLTTDLGGAAAVAERAARAAARRRAHRGARRASSRGCSRSRSARRKASRPSRPPACKAVPRLARRPGRDVPLGGGAARRARADPGPPPAGRRGRRDRAVELPARPLVPEALPRAADRLHRRPQAAGGDAAVRLPARRGLRAGRPAAGRAERRRRPTASVERGAGHATRWSTRSASRAARAAGRRIAALCGERLKRCSLELGGQVRRDRPATTPTSTRSIPALAPSTMANNGQTCHNQTRVLAPRARYDEVVEALREAIGALRGRRPRRPRDRRRPAHQRARSARASRRYIAARPGRGRAARRSAAAAPDRERGYFVEPTLFAGVDNAHDDRPRGDLRPGRRA